MDHQGFVTTVEQAAGVGRDDAETAIRATLSTLAERIDRGEAQDLAAQLPPEVAPWLATAGPAARFDFDEFLTRVAQREGTDVRTAERHAGAVLAALGRSVTPDELADLTAELPRAYSRILPAGQAVEVTPPDRFVRQVAERAGVDEGQARRAAEAVLETLAERIAGGDVEDLLVKLPVDFHDALRRGRERGGEQANRMPVEEFERRVAARAGVPRAEVRDHIRAVMAALREAIGDEDFSDIRAQLPREYDVLLGG